jgi:hypothetical protein
LGVTSTSEIVSPYFNLKTPMGSIRSLSSSFGRYRYFSDFFFVV